MIYVKNDYYSIHEAAERKYAQSSTYNIMHFNKAQQVLNLSYEQEQIEYFKTKIKDIENAATKTKLDMTWTIVNDVSGS